jgi:hypothetical protein
MARLFNLRTGNNKSDLQLCSPPACTALNTAIRIAGRFASLLPDSRFSRLPDQCFLTRRSLCSCSGPDARNGLSLTRNYCSFRSLHYRVNVPGLLLRFQTCRIYCSFGFLALLPIPVSPGLGGFHASSPLQFPQLVRLTATPTPAPLWGFYPPPDQSENWTCCLSARLPNSPDFLSLPAAAFYH